MKTDTRQMHASQEIVKQTLTIGGITEIGKAEYNLIPLRVWTAKLLSHRRYLLHVYYIFMNLPVVDSTGTLLFALHIFYSKQILPAANVVFVLQVQMLNLICPNFRWTHQTYWESPWITGLSWQQYPFRWTQAEVSVSPKISGLKPTMMKSTRAVLIRRKKWHNEHHFSDLPPPSLYSMINSIIDLSVTWLYQVKNKHLLLCMASRVPYT